MTFTFVRNFIKNESIGGILLFIAAIFALIISNSSLADAYQRIISVPFHLQVGHFFIAKPLSFWINEGLMTLFFLLVGLELKREFLVGELASISKVILPGCAALGGMLVPAAIYIGINYYQPETLKGWAIPVATDIAFALGVLSLFGKKVPIGLKLFLMALAIFDDIGAILIIAVFHTHTFFYGALLGAILILLLLQVLSYLGVRSLFFYNVLGVALWFCILQSGVHATIAGVLFASMVPFYKSKEAVFSPAYRLEKKLHPWVVFIILPIFALANAGVSFAYLDLSILFTPLSLGIIVGLVIGKQVGVFGFTWLVIRLKWASLPEKVNWQLIYGVSVLCGIGFTMSLFLGSLAFEPDGIKYLMQVRLSVLIASVLSGMIGVIILHRGFQLRSRRFSARCRT